MENNNIDPMKSLCDARDKAFESSGNLDLTKEERKQYSDSAEELSALIDQLAEQRIDDASSALSEQSELKSITTEINSTSKEIDWAHPHAQSANSNLGHLSKLIDSGRKMFALFQSSK
ncbi:MAG: hypothetical protein AB7W16_01840 [Candidatus Obscuribacterales bacterium]